jgi:hypothetical protein
MAEDEANDGDWRRATADTCARTAERRASAVPLTEPAPTSARRATRMQTASLGFPRNVGSASDPADRTPASGLVEARVTLATPRARRKTMEAARASLPEVGAAAFDADASARA